MTTLVAMGALAAATWVLRATFIVLVPAGSLPQAVRDGLQYLPPAVLAALVVVELVAATSDLEWQPALFTVTAMGVAAVVVRRTQRPVLAVAAGLAVALVLDLAWV